MIPYVLLMFVPFLFSMIAFSSSFKEKSSRWTVAVGGTREIADHSLMLPTFFLLLTVLLSLRDITIGRDLANYRHFFEKYLYADITAVFREGKEYLYWLLVWLVTRFTDSFQIFLTAAAVITVLPAAAVYCRDRQNGFLKIVLFMNMSTFVLLFSGLRQALAISVGLLAYEFVKKKQPVRFFLAALAAFGFHTSAIMVLLLYPLYYVTFRRKHLWFVIPGILLVLVFNRPIFQRAVRILESLLGDQYDAKISSTGAYTMLILFALFAVLAYVLPDEAKMDPETLGLRNYLLAAVVLQCFAPLHTLAMRMNYYFIIFIPLLIPRILQCSKQNYREVARLANAVMIGFFALYYLAGTYRSCQTGISTMNTYPYLPFWK